MNQVYPIIRRIRRPFLPLDDPAPVVQGVAVKPPPEARPASSESEVSGGGGRRRVGSLATVHRAGSHETFGFGEVLGFEAVALFGGGVVGVDATAEFPADKRISLAHNVAV